MTFKEYEEKAITTRVYSPKIALPYVVLGLCGETGEFFEKLELQAEESLIKKEIGDVLWYCAAIRVELNLDDISWPAPTELKSNTGFTVMSNMGIVAEQMKKYLRDDWKEDEHIEISEERKAKIHQALVILLESFQSIAVSTFGVTLQTIAEENIEKLAKRKENGMLHGSGDTRGE